MPVIEVICEHEAWESIPGLVDRLDRAAAAALAASGVRIAPQAEVSVLLTDDSAVQALNLRWRGKDAPTNVLSFPAVSPARLAQSPMVGDIALAYQTCVREAEAEGKAVADHATHLVVHGALHLVGFDHETEAEAETMEQLERQVLAGLGIADPYAGARLAEETA